MSLPARAPELLPDLAQWLTMCLLLALRIAPVFAFAPPFSLVRLPARFRLLFGLAIAASMAAMVPYPATLASQDAGALLAAGARELLLGGVFLLTFQVTFAALYFAGRTIDIQAGFGIAVLIDPTTRTQTPLIGMLFAYAAGAVFFAVDGHLDLLRILSASVDAVPVGTWQMSGSLDRLFAFMSAAFLAAFGFAGTAVAILFLMDLAIAVLSRAVPQMNALVLGFQVKTISLLLVLPICFGLGSALLLRLIRLNIEALPGLLD
ncbi:MAG TPA: flagellar biosynthetic protein FliR [Novosphingobium sp.]